MPIVGLEATVFFRRLLLTRVQLPGLHKKYAVNGTRTTISFSKATDSTCSTAGDTYRNMPVVGLEPTMFLSHGYS